MPRVTQRPPGSNWGDFGEGDELGRLNLITPERRLAAMEEVKEGRCFTLSLPLDFPGGDLQPPFRRPPTVTPTLPQHNYSVGELFAAPNARDTVNDDQVTLCTQYSTQWDGLCHVGFHFDSDADGTAESLYYNGFRADSDIVSRDENGNSNAKALGMEKMAVGGMQGRGVLVDFYSIYGERKVAVGYDEMMRALEAQSAEVRPGDLLCTYTGFGDLVLAMNRKPDTRRLTSSFVDLDGRDPKLLQWITDSGITAICSDTNSIEANPTPGPHLLSRPAQEPLVPLHHHCIFKLGMYLGELWYFGELAAWLRARKRNAFLLTAPPLHLPGAVGSPVTPIATV